MSDWELRVSVNFVISPTTKIGFDGLALSDFRGLFEHGVAAGCRQSPQLLPPFLFPSFGRSMGVSGWLLAVRAEKHLMGTACGDLTGIGAWET